MSNTPQRRAIKNYRKRLVQRGMVRFEIVGREADRDLLRSLAKRLAENDAEADRLRSVMTRSLGGESRKGGILESLRRSPLVGAEVIPARPFEPGRKVDL